MSFFGVVLVAIVLAGGLAAHDPAPHYFGHQDKVEHALAFFLLGVAFGWATSLRTFVLATAALVAFALGLELLQAIFTLTRTPSWKDAVASLFGLGCGLTCARLGAWMLSGSARSDVTEPARS